MKAGVSRKKEEEEEAHNLWTGGIRLKKSEISMPLFMVLLQSSEGPCRLDGDLVGPPTLTTTAQQKYYSHRITLSHNILDQITYDVGPGKEGFSYDGPNPAHCRRADSNSLLCIFLF
jgi:hypothetical protein